LNAAEADEYAQQFTHEFDVATLRQRAVSTALPPGVIGVATGSCHVKGTGIG
jgi:hypothetical protein